MVQDGEQVATTGDAMKHAMEFAKQLLPFSSGDALQGQGGRENPMQAFRPVWGQGDGMCDGINVPAQQRFLCIPSGITFKNFVD